MVFKGRPPNEFSKDLTRKSGFSKIEQNADVGKTTKTPPCERTYFSRYPSPKISRIGSLSMKLSPNNDRTVNKLQYLVIYVKNSGFFRKSQNADVEKTTKTSPRERAYFSRHFALPHAKIGSRSSEKSQISKRVKNSHLYII